MIREIQLGDLYLNKGGSVDPSKFLNETFEYYSIPAYDRGFPEIVPGSQIGSSKKIFRPNDVILSRIIPHTRRCWIVGASNGYRQIGSSEWITFRSNDIVPSYLRFYLMSNDFNAKFLKTIKGVGGSLMRADPNQVARFKIPLPPLPQQQKIANILDAADALRQKDKALLAKYDELTQSLFLDMFGDPVSNPKGWDKKVATDYYEVRGRVGWKGYKKTDLRQEGAIVIGATHVTNKGELDLTKVVYLSNEKFVESPEIKVVKYDLIFVQRGNTIGKICLVRNELTDATINPVVLIFRPINANPFFLLYLLLNKELNREFVNSNSGSAQPMITQKFMREFMLIDVPIELQNQFAERVQIIEQQKAIAQKSLEKSEQLFNSLLQKAFIGELV